MFKTILVPVDLEEKNMAKPALDRAIALADQAGASLRLVNVQPLLPTTFLESIPADFDEQQRQWAEQTLAQMAAKIPLPVGRVSHCVRTGGIYPNVLEEAEHWGADLIVIGSHRPSMSTYLLGSNATTIVRHALCSVLVVRD